MKYIQEANKIKSQLREQLGDKAKSVPRGVDYMAPSSKEEILRDAPKLGIMADEKMDMDVRSLRETLTYGFKGMAAYAHHALVLRKQIYD